MGEQVKLITNIAKKKAPFIQVTQLGSNWNNGLIAGGFCWFVVYSSASRARYFGGGAVNALYQKSL